MKFLRMLAIVLGVALTCGVFGAAVGGLVGVAMPGSFRVAKSQEGGDPGKGEPTKTFQATEVQVGQGDDELPTGWKGASLGGAIGLMIGVMLGIPVAVLDQLVVARSRWLPSNREEEAARRDPHTGV